MLQRSTNSSACNNNAKCILNEFISSFSVHKTMYYNGHLGDCFKEKKCFLSTRMSRNLFCKIYVKKDVNVKGG